jgi:hypothetical protein
MIMHLYDISFTADEGISAIAETFYPDAEVHGFVTLTFAKPGTVYFEAGRVCFTMPYSMAAKAHRIAAAINEIMAEDDATDDKPLVETFTIHADPFWHPAKEG